MQVIGLASSRLASRNRNQKQMRGRGLSRQVSLWVALIGLLASGCNPQKTEVRVIPIQQSWQLNPGETIGDHRIVSSLGDVSIEVRGDRIYAPFDGQLQANDLEGCYVFSSPDVPAYLFRLCGLKRVRLGNIQRGTRIGSANYLGFATLRRQPDGNWALVEPSSDVLERLLDPNSIQVGGGEETPAPE